MAQTVLYQSEKFIN